MPIQVGCGRCARIYRVDGKFAGKKIRCKECGGVIQVEGEEVPAAAEAVQGKAGAVRATSAPAVKQAVRPAARQAVKEAIKPELVPEALDLPELPDLSDLPSEPQGDVEEMPVAPPCPSCGNPLPAANVVCIACGYNRSKGRKVQTAVARERPERGRALDYAARRDSSGVRLWEPYRNPLLNAMDTWGPKGAVFVYVAYALVMALLGGGSGAAFVGVIVVVFFFAFLFWVVLPISLYGVGVAGKWLKFEVREDGKSRILATQVIAGLVFALVWSIGISQVPHGALGLGDPFRTLGLVAGVLMASFCAYLVACYMAFILFFHLRLIEGLLAYLMMMMFYILGGIVALVLCYAILFVIGLALHGVMAR